MTGTANVPSETQHQFSLKTAETLGFPHQALLKPHRNRSTTCWMRKDKRTAPKSGYQLQFGSTVTISSGSPRSTRHFAGKMEGWEGAKSRETTDSSLSWPEDPEPAHFHPPSQSRPAQPCRRRALSPPHLGGGGRERCSHGLGWWLATRTDTEQTPEHQAPHLESSWWPCWPPSSSERAQTSSPGWSCCYQWPLDPEGQTDTRSDDGSHEALWTLI